MDLDLHPRLPHNLAGILCVFFPIISKNTNGLDGLYITYPLTTLPPPAPSRLFELVSLPLSLLLVFSSFGCGAAQDLESADRTLTPWLVAMMHCPWYNSNLAHQGERQTETAMRTMEPLLYQHKAAVVVSGHVHGATPSSVA